jgi:hypothetical protein
MRRFSVPQVLLGLVGLVSVELGIWATFAPRSFYDDFPGGNGTWVSVNGPYNEHFIRDFGGLNLALAALLLVAAWKGGTTLIRLAAAGALLFGVPHLVHHVRHVDVFTTDSDKFANIAALALAVAGPAIALLLSLRKAPRPASR